MACPRRSNDTVKNGADAAISSATEGELLGHRRHHLISQTNLAYRSPSTSARV
jgi:hypothetical protein